MSDPFYVTTPIYYVNDAPHIGSAYTTIACDALARYHRARGQDTWFLTGTDEHGQKIEEAATAAGRTPIAHADHFVARFQDAWRKLDISNDDFIRTTEQRHKDVVADIWRRLEAAGAIYLADYEDWYCVGCESFYTETQLVPGDAPGVFLCPDHKRPVQRLKEQSYFFRMAQYAQPLLDYIEAHPGFIQPDFRKNEVVAFVKAGLRDLSVSRRTFKWGIPVPGAPEHVIYVWIDALTNYMSALGGPGAAQYDKFWPQAVHVIGKDILRHHAVYWPTMLLAAGLPLPKTVFAHGWWTANGQKISKSLGNAIDPLGLAADVGVDALRYFLLRETSFGLDGDFSHDAFLGRLNSDLANDLGNLVHRCVKMTELYAGGVIPRLEPGAFEDHPVHGKLAALAIHARDTVAEHMERLQPTRALEALWELVRGGNKYIDDAAPWVQAKDPARAAELSHTVRHFLEALSWIALMVAPFMPKKAGEILDRLGVPGGPERLLRWPRAWGRELTSGQKVVPGEPLWPRLDDDRKAELKARWGVKPADKKPEKGHDKGSDKGDKKAEKSAEKAPATVAAPPPGSISYDDFKKLDLRVAVVTTAEKVPKADKLLKLTLDLGGETRTVVAGIAAAYAPEALPGKKVIFLANLAPATIRGVRSEGMILAAGDEQVIGLSAIDCDVPPGTKVR